jgi:hypothetical protein
VGCTPSISRGLKAVQQVKQENALLTPKHDMHAPAWQISSCLRLHHQRFTMSAWKKKTNRRIYYLNGVGFKSPWGILPQHDYSSKSLEISIVSNVTVGPCCPPNEARFVQPCQSILHQTFKRCPVLTAGCPTLPRGLVSPPERTLNATLH